MRLVFERGPSAGRRIRLKRQGDTIGRAPTNSIPVNDPKVSRHHASIQWRNGTYFIRDLGSQNGTYLNGERLDRPAALKPGDRIDMGGTRLIVQGEAVTPRGEPRDWVEWGQKGHEAWEKAREARERRQARRAGEEARARYSPRPQPARTLGELVSTVVSSPLFPLVAAGVGAVIAVISTRSGRTPPATPVVSTGGGWGTGDVQITLRWHNTADLDLHVIDPNGEEIYYGHRHSATGGELDVDANRGCSGSGVSPVENVYWPYGGAPTGTYRVVVDYFEECRGEGPTRWELRTKVDGRIRDFSGTLSSEGAQQTVTTFNR